ncbi:MAG: response regulator [Microcoleus sp. PH2017_17_BER_D_A]|nr:response regulator [Microcoleus sp. PH2017_17_BER_D_A]
MSKILVVDDVPSELEIICRILQDAGMQVIRAGDGEEAIALIREVPPDLVVLDVVMPRMNGFEVIRELRGDRATAHLPVVFCTHKNTDIDKAWGTDLGADAYVSKPFEPQQLVNIVQRLLWALSRLECAGSWAQSFCLKRWAAILVLQQAPQAFGD